MDFLSAVEETNLDPDEVGQNLCILIRKQIELKMPLIGIIIHSCAHLIISKKIKDNTIMQEQYVSTLREIQFNYIHSFFFLKKEILH